MTIKQLSTRTVHIIGRVGSSAAIVMFLANLDQVRLNMMGQKGSLIMPVATFFNCIIWVIYAYEHNKDWPLFWCNLVGVFASLASIISFFVF